MSAITCVTVSHNGAESTIQLLGSLADQVDQEFGVVVVDNGSDLDDRERLAAFGETVAAPIQLILSPENLGFSGGNNVGIRRALARGTEWVVLINNDTVVEPDFAAALRRTLDGAGPGDTVVGLPLQEGTELVRAGRRRWLALEQEHHPDPDAAPDAYAVGGGMAINRRVLERIGLLDEAYFLYFEDVDFSERARRAGVELHFATEPVIRHRVATSARKLGAPLLARYHARNAIRFNTKNGPWWVRVLVGPWIAIVLIRALAQLVVGRDRPRSRAVIAGVRDAIAKRWGIIDPRVAIGIDCESLESSSFGLGRLVSNLVVALGERDDVRDRYQVILYSNGPLPESVHYDDRLCITRSVGLPSLLGSRARPSFVAYYFLLLPLAVRRDRPAAMFYPNYMLPLGAARGSLVLLTDDVFREVEDGGLSFRNRMLYRIFSVGRAARRADRVMTLSEASAEHLESRGVDRARIVVNPLAVDPPRTDVEPAPPVTFLFVGQAFPRRHLEEALRAFDRIAATEAATFRIIGPDRYPEAVVGDLVEKINSAQGRPAVRWEQSVGDDELAAAYRSAGAVVYVSATEAFGLPPFEALSYGTPAVIADTPLNRELYGPHAFYVPTPITDAGILAAMTASMHDAGTRDSIRAAAATITERYTWARHADRFLAAVRDLASS